jgi:hypothetical protein
MPESGIPCLTSAVASGNLEGEMIRYAAALSVLVLAACAQPPSPASEAQIQAANARADEAAQVYQDLQLTQFEQQMTDDDKRLTYGFAVVNCGLRNQQWLDMLQNVYSRDYATEFQRHPLTPEQTAEARAYAESHISNPYPPPYICQLLSTDSSLPDLDYSVGVESLILASEKKKTG